MGNIIIDFSNWIWGPPILVLLLGGGTFFFIHSGFVPLTKMGHAIELLKGKYEDKLAPGQITSKQALMSAIAYGTQRYFETELEAQEKLPTLKTSALPFASKPWQV